MATGAWAHNFPASKDAHPTYIDYPTAGWDTLVVLVIHEIFTALDAMQDALGYDILNGFADLNTRLEQLDHATKAHGIYDRGDPAAFDYLKAALTTDATWRDLDLSAIVPANAKYVLLRTSLESANPGDMIRYRENGNANEINICSCESLRANVERNRMVMVACDANRVIEYNADNIAWTTLSIVVRGWWVR